MLINIRVIPCLLLKNGGLVKTIKFSSSKYIGDPINAIKLFNELEVDELVIFDIEATKKNKKIDYELISKIASECFMPLAYGGGIRSIDDIKKLFRNGVEKVVMNTTAFTNEEIIKQSSDIFGSQSILVSIDAKKTLFGKYVVHINCGMQNTGVNPVDYALKMEKLGVGEIIINSINNDGMMNGYDLKLIESISNSVSVPVVALGGAGNLNHCKDAVVVGASAVAAGSMFVFHGRKKGVLINYPLTNELSTLFKDFLKEKADVSE